MVRAEKKSAPGGASEPNTRVAGEQLPPVVPPKKHPWLLALSALLVLGWLCFLAFMAMAE